MPWPVNPVLNSTLANMGMPAGFAWPQGLMQGIPGMALAMPGLTGALPTGTHVDLLSSLMAGTARTVSLHNNSTAAAKTDTDAITAQTQSGNPAPAVSGPAHMDLPTGITSQLEALLAAGLVGQQLSGLVQITPGLGDAQHTLAVSRHASTTMLNTLDSAPQAAIAASNNALSMLERIPNAGKAQPSGLGVQAATPAARAVLAADSPAGAIRTCTDIAEALNRAGSRPSSTSLAAQAEAAGAVEGGRGSRRAAGRPQRYSTSAANPANSGPNPCMPRPASMLALVEAAAAAAAAADGGTQTHTATAPAGTVRTTNSSMSTEQDEGESLSPLPSQTTGRMQRAEVRNWWWACCLPSNAIHTCCSNAVASDILVGVDSFQLFLRNLCPKPWVSAKCDVC